MGRICVPSGWMSLSLTCWKGTCKLSSKRERQRDWNWQEVHRQSIGTPVGISTCAMTPPFPFYHHHHHHQKKKKKDKGGAVVGFRCIWTTPAPR